MGIKLFGVGGIDQKSNHLLRNDLDLLDSRNVMIDINGEYIKRPGTVEDGDFTGETYSDMIFIKSLDEYFYRKSSTYGVVRNGTPLQAVVFQDPTTDVTSKISLAEYLDTAIFTHEEGQLFTAKYDGRSVYRAGLPTPDIALTAGSGTGLYMLSFYEFIDAAGNTVFGPATITEFSSSSTPTFTVSTFKTNGFYGGFIRIATSSTPVVIDASNRTITSVSGTQRSADFSAVNPIAVGTKIPIRNNSNGLFSTNPLIVITDTASMSNSFSDFTVMLEVESVTTNTITFTAASIGTKKIEITTPSAGVNNILGSLKLRLFFSDNESTGFLGYNGQEAILLDNSMTSQSITPSLVITNPQNLSDFYDITTSKLRPPKCKYVFTYGYQLLCAPALSFWDFNNKETTYTNNDLIMYSDVSTGDIGENFSEINRQLIGNTYDGQITGLGRVRDSVIAFKDRMVFALDGILIPGQYTLRKIETNEIGCTSFKSILSVSDGLLFQGQDGLYATDGYKAIKVTENLDPFFRTINNTLSRSVVNNDLDQHLIWTDQGMVVFDYQYKKWFIWDSIDASKGITVDNESVIRFFDSSKAVMFQDDLNDSGVAIDAHIRSNWLNAKEPGLLKKATFLRLYSFNNEGQSVQLKYFLDWSENKTKGPFTIDMSDPETKAIKRNLDIILNQSFSFEFRNNVIDENLNISGYEVNAGVIQEVDKNVK